MVATPNPPAGWTGWHQVLEQYQRTRDAGLKGPIIAYLQAVGSHVVNTEAAGLKGTSYTLTTDGANVVQTPLDLDAHRQALQQRLASYPAD